MYFEDTDCFTDALKRTIVPGHDAIGAFRGFNLGWGDQ